MATTSTTSIPTADSTQYYTSKYGRILILTGDNYAALLLIAGLHWLLLRAWSIVDGSEPRPSGAAAGTSWDDERPRLFN